MLHVLHGVNLTHYDELGAWTAGRPRCAGRCAGQARDVTTDAPSRLAAWQLPYVPPRHPEEGAGHGVGCLGTVREVPTIFFAARP
jgi:hypothetical protein